MPKLAIDVELEELAEVLNQLDPDELETLEMLLDSELGSELQRRREQGRAELKQGTTLSEDDLFGSDS